MTENIRNALVTGAAKRIGRQIALDLAADGWRVAVHYSTSKDAAEQVVAEIVERGGTSMSVRGDLFDADVPPRIVSEAAQALGPLGLLVNNASRFERDDLGAMSVDDWESHMAVNLRAPVFLAREFAAQLPRGEKGNVVNLIDERVWRLNPEFYSYTLSKAALWSATQTMAMALAPDIRVNAIAPGPALASARMAQSEFEKQCRLMPLGVGTSPGELSSALRFILSASAMTGQMIALDGGQHLAWQTPDFLEISE